MQKQAPTAGRLLVMVGFALSCFGLLLFLWLSFGGPIPFKPNGYRFSMQFSQGNQLAQEADVRVSGVSVGKVKKITVSNTGTSRVTMELQPRYAPIPRDTRAILRQKTLLGETYVELSPGERSSGMLQDGGQLPPAQVAPSVQLDQIFRAFDPRTRAAFQDWMQTLAVSVAGRGKDISDALGNLAPFARDANTIALILDAQQPEVQRLVANTGDVFNALTERDSDLRSLITNSNQVFQTTAQRNAELQAAFVALPTFERESALTLDRLARFARATNPLVTQLRPAARQLSPTLKDLAAIAPDLKGLFRDVNPLVDASTAGLPATQSFLDELHPLLGSLDPLLSQLNPILVFLGQYKNELTAFFANSVAATQAVDTPAGAKAPIHYLRTTNPFNPESLAVYSQRNGSNRPTPYAMPNSFMQLPVGMPVYETRQCGRPAPTISPALTNLIPDVLRQQIQQFAFGVTGSNAPPCKQQGPYSFGGQVTRYPHVNAFPSGSVRGHR
jgi:virulence factor Mce-like protein